MGIVLSDLIPSWYYLWSLWANQTYRGDWTITATAGDATAVLKHVAFGDVWCALHLKPQVRLRAVFEASLCLGAKVAGRSLSRQNSNSAGQAIYHHVIAPERPL